MVLTERSAASSWSSVDTGNMTPSLSSSAAAVGVRGPYFCNVCLLPCSGPQPWQQHVQSAKHLKKMALAGQAAAGTGSPRPPDRLGPAPSVHEVLQPAPSVHEVLQPAPSVHEVLQPGGHFCQLCRVPCSGPEPWRQHVQGASHRKRAAQAGLVTEAATATARQSPPASVSAVSDSPAAGRMDVDPSTTRSYSPAVSTGLSFFCDLCQLSVTGPEPWKQHVLGTKHVKKMADAGRFSPAPDMARGAFPNSAPSSEVDVSGVSAVLDSPAAGRMDVDPSTTRSYSPAVSTGLSFFCDLCQLSVTGPEPWKQHVLGTKHMKKMADAGRFSPAPDMARSVFPSSAPSSEVDVSRCVVDGRSPDRAPVCAASARVLLAGEIAGHGDGAPPSELWAVCRDIRIGSWLHQRVDRLDGISSTDSLLASGHLSRLHPEGLVAFLEDTPLIRAEQPFSRARC